MLHDEDEDEDGDKVYNTTMPLYLKGQEMKSPDGSSNNENEEQKSPEFALDCLFCSVQYTADKQEELLRHLLLEHKFVIADVKLVADFPKYIRYWKDRFRDKAVGEFCSVIKTNSAENDKAPSDYYHLLCDLLPEDKDLRELLQRDRLEMILELNRREREDKTFSRVCLFCAKKFLGNRQQIFHHMLEDHNFNVGRPDNIVYGPELLDTLDSKLKSLQCLYCEKTFKSWEILKEHMRKKQHKKINPKNSAYDKFYVINYLELGKNWETLNLEEDLDETLPSEAEEWSDWKEEESLGAVCLFCDLSSTSFDTLCKHMLDVHAFNLTLLKTQMKLNFYHQVKLINYIRRQVFRNNCYGCGQTFASSQELSQHLQRSNHIMQLPDAAEWDQPQFFFSTYENDNLLCIIDDDDDDCVEENTLGVTVHPEDIISNNSPILCDELQRISLINEPG